MSIIELTKDFVNKIIEIEKKRMEIGRNLRNADLSNAGEEVLEKKTFFRIEKSSLEKNSIAGVDGGMVKKSLHGIDIILLRAVGVIFYFKNKRIEKVDYHPNSIPIPKPIILFDPFSELEFEINSNMERQTIETKTAIEMIEKFKPDVLFLNGSIVPHYTERPSENSLLFPTYKKMIDSYKELLKEAIKRGVVLAGVIEDSRGKRFCEIMSNTLPMEEKTSVLLERTKDTNILTYMLEKNERSLVFSYSSNPSNHPVLKEFGIFSQKIFSFYLRPSEFERPIRIDFIEDKDAPKTANEISSLILALSGDSSYGIPSVLIEADQRARLSEEEIELFYSSLKDMAGNLSSLFELRRNQRPF
ncbi:MAG: DNA double-strand break repair nuclease NurA [Candidatus Aenigmatarchaeota archaeon]